MGVAVYNIRYQAPPLRSKSKSLENLMDFLNIETSLITAFVILHTRVIAFVGLYFVLFLFCVCVWIRVWLLFFRLFVCLFSFWFDLIFFFKSVVISSTGKRWKEFQICEISYLSEYYHLYPTDFGATVHKLFNYFLRLYLQLFS